jgi:hypothetical protein
MVIDNEMLGATLLLINDDHRCGETASRLLDKVCVGHGTATTCHTIADTTTVRGAMGAAAAAAAAAAWMRATEREADRELLRGLASLAQGSDETWPSVMRYLGSYLRQAGTTALLADAVHADGAAALDDVLLLLERVPVGPFERLYAALLAPLNDVFGSGGPRVKARLLACLRRLVARWAGTTPLDVDELPPRTAALRALCRHTTRLASLALAAHPTHPLIEHHVLAVHERCASLHSRHAWSFVVPPPRAVVRRCLVSLNASAVSRACGLILTLGVTRATRTLARSLQLTRPPLVVARMSMPHSANFNANQPPYDTRTHHFNCFCVILCCQGFAAAENSLESLVQIACAALWNGNLGSTKELSFAHLGIAE